MKNIAINNFLYKITYSTGNKPNKKNSLFIYNRLKETGFIFYFIYLYVHFFNVLSRSKKLVELNKKFILYKFVAGVVILVYESDSEFHSTPPKTTNYSTNQKNQLFDTIVVGSGPGGSIAALRLLEKGEKSQ